MTLEVDHILREHDGGRVAAIGPAGEKRVRVDRVHQILAGGHHVSPGAEILLQAIGGIEVEEQQRLHAGDRLGGLHAQADRHIRGFSW